METISVNDAQKAFTNALRSMGITVENGTNGSHGNGSNPSTSTAYSAGDIDNPIILRTSDIEDPGQELSAGQDKVVSLHEVQAIERIILPDNNLLPVHFLEEGAISQKAVARVRVPGVGYGTGFMVSPTLFMTNNHVINSVSRANESKFEFNYQTDKDGNNQSTDTYSANPTSVFYTNPSLDFTIVRLKPKSIFWPIAPPVLTVGEVENNGLNGVVRPTRFLPYLTHAGQKWGSLTLKNSNYATGAHINIVQHPRARRKEVALQDNELTNIYTTRVRYTTDTEPGSSGSPVFNNAWDLVAIHHAAGASSGSVWLNNQGIRMDKIIADIKNHFSSVTNGVQVISELGI